MNGSHQIHRLWARPLLATTLVLGAFLLGGRAQQPPDASPPAGDPPPDQVEESAEDQTDPQGIPVFRTGINFVRVDTIVTDDDGNHVDDLQASDFEIYEDDVLQEIETFELIEISALPAPDAEPPRRVVNRNDAEREAARTDVRVFVIFFDDYHVRFENGERASLQVASFLEENLLPTDLVAVMFPLTPLSDLQLTRDHDLVIDQVRNWFGRKYFYEPQNMYEQLYAEYPTETVELIRNDVSLSALRGLMMYLGGIREARKSVLLVSEGYTNYLPPQLRAINAMQGPNPLINPAVGDPMAAESGMEQREEFFRNSSIQLDLRYLYSTANRFNTAFYTLDPRGLAVGEFDVSQPVIDITTNWRLLRGTQDTLRILAEQTDGRAIVNQNDFESGMRQMLRDSSVYYLIGYNSSGSPTDGEFHEIDVRVKRDGVKIRSRPGYWALSERDAERAMAPPTANAPPRAIDRALGNLAEPSRGYLVRTWVGTSRGDDGQTRVTFVWEPTRGQPARLGEPARVLLTAMNDAGDAFRARIPERAGSSGRGLAGGDGRESDLTMATFNVAPGTLQMSLAIEGDSGEVLDRDRDAVDVPDFTGPDLTFSTPAFVRTRNNVEWEQLVDDWDAVPTPTREFRRTERLLLRFDVYAAGTTVADVEAWLLNRRGDRMYPLVLQPAEGGHPNQVDIQPTNLPPGEYVVELTATTSQDERTELVAFRLTS